MRILLTGFEPFGGDDVNSSQEVVRTLSCDESGGVELVTSILSVSFKRTGNAICRLIDATEPDVVIMLGQSGKTDCIKIERIAVNMMDAKKPDNDGYTPDEEFIISDGPSAYFSSISVKHLRNQLDENGIPAKVSNSAGLYVCNTAYFNVLHHISILGKEIKSVFVHLPKISEQWSLSKLLNAVKQLILATRS